MPIRSDVQIVKRVLAGDRESFRTLVETYYPLAFRITKNLVRDDRTAEDLCQESFLRMFSKLSLFNQSRPFKPWAMRIVTNIALRHLEKKRLEVSFDQNSLDLISLPDHSPATIVAKQSFVDTCLQSLPIGTQICFLLKFSLGFSYDEIGFLLDEPPGTIKSLVSRAAKNIQQHFAQEKTLEA